MKLPRDLSAQELIRALRKLGYEPVRQAGSHIRIRTMLNGEHHETIPSHGALKAGTLNVILKNIAAHHALSRDELLTLLGL
jgi:predicted RNA binding protein YcfA (HicA-like mRNA interferase family)